MDKQFKSLKVELEQFVINEVNNLKNELFDNVKAETPVDTGYAQSQWEKTPDIKRLGQDAIIGNDVEYVKYLEDGTPHMAPRGFINRNITKSLNRRK